MGQWIDTWRPRDDSDAELGLILEDDISASPYAYRWLRAVHRAYRNRTDFVGSSLMKWASRHVILKVRWRLRRVTRHSCTSV